MDSLFNALSDMGFIGVVFGLIIFIGIPSLFLFAFGFVINLLLGMIRNRPIQITLTIICFILFLPCMMMFYNSFTLTKSEELLGVFSLNLRNRSRLLIFVTVVYIFLYYKIFTFIF